MDPYSGAGRGPVVSAANTLALADGKSSVMTFTVNLCSNKAGGAGRLYILKDNSQAGTDKNGAYNNVRVYLQLMTQPQATQSVAAAML